MTMVKICGLCQFEDARLAWKCDADLLGFILVPGSARYLEPDKVQAIVARLRSEGCTTPTVGVFVDESPDLVRSIARQCSLNHVQLHGSETVEYVQRLGLSAIVARRVRQRIPWTTLRQYPAWAYLLDTDVTGQDGGTGQTWSWSHLRGHTETPVFLAGGLTCDNVASAMRSAKPCGVDVSSGVEASLRHKDPGKVERFIQTVRREDQNEAT
jgi:phosphoribosylanthranilate isomerase